MSGGAFHTDRDYFAAIADTYDRLQPVVAGPAFQAGLDFMLDLVPYETGDEFACVELGCGTATLTRAVLDRFPRARAVAIDSEPAMLDLARSKLAPYGDRAEVRQADASVGEIPPCDVVLTSFMLHHVAPERMPAFFGRVVRALAPSGCLLVLDTMGAGPRWGEGIGAVSGLLYREHVRAAIASGAATQEEIDARWEFKRRMKAEGRDVEYRHAAEDILRLMGEAGLGETGLVWRQLSYTILMGLRG